MNSSSGFADLYKRSGNFHLNSRCNLYDRRCNYDNNDLISGSHHDYQPKNITVDNLYVNKLIINRQDLRSDSSWISGSELSNNLNLDTRPISSNPSSHSPRIEPNFSNSEHSSINSGHETYTQPYYAQYSSPSHTTNYLTTPNSEKITTQNSYFAQTQILSDGSSLEDSESHKKKILKNHVKFTDNRDQSNNMFEPDSFLFDLKEKKKFPHQANEDSQIKKTQVSNKLKFFPHSRKNNNQRNLNIKQKSDSACLINYPLIKEFEYSEHLFNHYPAIQKLANSDHLKFFKSLKHEPNYLDISEMKIEANDELDCNNQQDHPIDRQKEESSCSLIDNNIDSDESSVFSLNSLMINQNSKQKKNLNQRKFRSRDNNALRTTDILKDKSFSLNEFPLKIDITENSKTILNQPDELDNDEVLVKIEEISLSNSDDSQNQFTNRTISNITPFELSDQENGEDLIQKSLSNSNEIINENFSDLDKTSNTEIFVMDDFKVSDQNAQYDPFISHKEYKKRFQTRSEL